MNRNELNDRKGWSLARKIDHTLGVIEQYYHLTDGKVYVSFSGGKDSSVLLYLIRRLFDDRIPAVFCNTGNEFPEIIKFVNTVPNVRVIRPKMTVREVIERYGFPLISKEQAKYICEAKYSKSPIVVNKRLHGERGSVFQGTISKTDLLNFLRKSGSLPVNHSRKKPVVRYPSIQCPPGLRLSTGKKPL